MGYRLSKIVTKQGDDGTTSLDGITRISKDDQRLCTMGDVDELNSFIGLLGADVLNDELGAILQQIQQHLFNLGAELALPDYAILRYSDIELVDNWCEQLNAQLPPLKEFILPRGSRVVGLAHCCRTIARRAERSLVTLSHKEDIRQELLAYLNRLSDLFFILARYLNQDTETYWLSEKLRASDVE